jgi:hypothetical protein
MSVFSVRGILAASLLCITVQSIAQTNTQEGKSNKENDPYSRYGLGEPISGTNVLNRGMGYTTTAFQNASAVNTENPASYSSLRLTTYEAAFTGGLRNILTDNKTYNTGSASFAYLRVGIPLTKHAGMAFGLQPQSHIFYHSVDTANVLVDEPSGHSVYNRVASEYTGEGGLNYAFIGGAGKVGGFSFGANFGYMFGNIRNTSRIVNLDSTHVLGSDFSKYTRIGGIYWKGGIQYHDTLKNGWHLRIGATAAISQQLNGSRESYSSSFFYNSGSEIQDTAYRTTGQSGKIILPATYSLGAQLGGGNWSVAVDGMYTDWSVYRNYDVPDSVKSNTMRINFGGEYTPDPTKVYGYFQRVTYRAGFYYGTDYVQLRNTDMSYYGFTLGASFPFKRSPDRIHTAFEFGRRGTQANGLVQMNYFKFHLGISLNDRWFIKRTRYD